MALLLLRVALAGALLLQGFYYLRETDPAPGPVTLGLISLAAGALLLIGLLTPVAAAVAGLGGIGIACSLLPASTPPPVNSGMALLFAASILFAVIILGPGAFSVDARLFGRREIIIPRRSDS